MRTKRTERREEILAATWQLIARQGLRAANMRAIAAEVGYANGALAYYFAGKDDLVRGAYEYVLKQTAARIQLATEKQHGLAALRAFCAEIIPADELKLLEARIVIPFWEGAIHEPAFARLHEEGIADWRKQIRRHLREAEQLGEARALSAKATAVLVEQLLSILAGAQVLGVLSGDVHTSRMQNQVVEAFLDGLRP